MEITYETIIKYLEKPKNKQHEFITQKNIYKYVKSFPLKFQNLLCDKIYRYGITVYNNKDNISFWSSLLTLLDKDFIITFNTDEISSINKFKTSLLEIYPAKYNHDKNDIKELLKIEPNNIILQYIVDVLDINFIILDFKTENINLMYKSKIMNPFKPILLFANYIDFWEPILLNGTTIIREFSYNDIIIKKLLYSENIKYYNSDNEIHINDNINTIMDKESKLLKPKLSLESKSESIFIKSDTTNYQEMGPAKLNRLTKTKLIEIAKSLNFTTDMSKMLKTAIIDMIIKPKA
jgi:hypothetical protein